MKRENYKNFILKTLLENGGSMQCRDTIKKFKDMFLHGRGKIYLRADEVAALHNEDFLYDTISWARSELRVNGLLHKGNPVGLWVLTPEGEKAAQEFWPDDNVLYLENMQQQIKEALAKITDPEAKKQFIDALLQPD